MDRSRWASIRENGFGDGVNRRSLEIIEKAMFMLVLDERAPTEWNERGSILLHGKGEPMLWYDKSFNLVVFANGHAGLNAEHSWADALVSAHMWEHVLTGEARYCGSAEGGIGRELSSTSSMTGEGAAPVYEENGHCRVYETDKVTNAIGKDSKTNNLIPPALLLQWELPPEIAHAAKLAVEDSRKMAADLQLEVHVYDLYGKGFMKQSKVSPDAWVQMALQLAFYRDHGRFELTYEAAMVRLMLHSYCTHTHTVHILILYSYCTHTALVLHSYSYCTHTVGPSLLQGEDGDSPPLQRQVERVRAGDGGEGLQGVLEGGKARSTACCCRPPPAYES
jgi:carnitine O-palmitoyltransferase 1